MLHRMEEVIKGTNINISIYKDGKPGQEVQDENHGQIYAATYCSL